MVALTSFSLRISISFLVARNCFVFVAVYPPVSVHLLVNFDPVFV